MAESAQITAVTGHGIAAKAAEVAQLASGKPYTWGGKTTEGFDCSGFVSYVFKQLYPHAGAVFDLNVAGYASSDLFDDVTAAQPGDIIIFPASGGNVAHIGIVYDAEHWIGSQSSTGVAKVKFTQPWWSRRTHKFRRYRSTSPEAMAAGQAVQSAPALP